MRELVFKKAVALCLLVAFLWGCSGAAFAESLNGLSGMAVRLDNSSMDTDIHKRLYKKYYPVRLTIINKSKDDIRLPSDMYFLSKGKVRGRVPSQEEAYNGAKIHTVRRAVLWCIPPATTVFLLIAVPVVATASMATSAASNTSLKDSIEKVSFRPNYVFAGQTYEGYVFLPKRFKNANEVVLRNIVLKDGTRTDLIVPVSEESL